jgi:hypothetical protein
VTTERTRLLNSQAGISYGKRPHSTANRSRVNVLPPASLAFLRLKTEGGGCQSLSRVLSLPNLVPRVMVPQRDESQGGHCRGLRSGYKVNVPHDTHTSTSNPLDKICSTVIAH